MASIRGCDVDFKSLPREQKYGLLESQFQAMAIWMLTNYGGGRCKIEAALFAAASSSFGVNEFAIHTCYSVEKSRRVLKKLAAAGVITQKQYRPGSSLSFMLTGDIRTAIVAEAENYWIACGYSKDEMRTRNRDTELPMELAWEFLDRMGVRDGTP